MGHPAETKTATTRGASKIVAKARSALGQLCARREALIIIGLLILNVVSVIGWLSAPKKLTLYYPPDLTLGAQQTVDAVPKASVYSFAFYVFQQLNHWPSNGEKDYITQLNAMRDYITPAWYAEREGEYDIRLKRGELSSRVRKMHGIPGRGYYSWRVRRLSMDSWVVGIDFHIREIARGVRIKDLLIHYPLRVVRYDSAEGGNPFGLALDGFSARPSPVVVGTKTEEG